MSSWTTSADKIGFFSIGHLIGRTTVTCKPKASKTNTISCIRYVSVSYTPVTIKTCSERNCELLRSNYDGRKYHAFVVIDKDPAFVLAGAISLLVMLLDVLVLLPVKFIKDYFLLKNSGFLMFYYNNILLQHSKSLTTKLKRC